MRAFALWVYLALLLRLAYPLSVCLKPAGLWSLRLPGCSCTDPRLWYRSSFCSIKALGIRARVVTACQEAEEPDADLVSGYFDDEDASVLSEPAVEVAELSPAEALDLLRDLNAVMLDLRTPKQHGASHPPGALNIPAGEPGPSGILFHFREDFEDLVQQHATVSSFLVLLCDVGVVSRVAVVKLAAKGIFNVRVVSGGFEAWFMDENMPCEPPEGRPTEKRDPLHVGFDLEPWSLWSSDEGQLPMQPVLHIEEADSIDVDVDVLPFNDEVEDVGEMVRMVEEEQKEEEDAKEHLLSQQDDNAVGAQDEPSDELDDSARGEPQRNEVDLAELERLLGDGAIPAPGSSDASSRISKRFDEAPSASKTAPGAQAAPAAGSARNFYAASVTDYGGPSRAPKGIKQRRTRSGLPPAWLVDISHLDIGSLIESGSLLSLSVKELKSYLYKRDVGLSGPKRELVARITEVYQREQKQQGSSQPEAAATSLPHLLAKPPEQSSLQSVASRGSNAAAASVPQVNGRAKTTKGAIGYGAQAAGADDAASVDDSKAELLELFDSDGPQDDFMIDEVFSAM